MEPARRLIGSVTAMEVAIAFTGVPVTSLATGRDFFDCLFGRPADVEVRKATMLDPDGNTVAIIAVPA
jgi:hypothetical protein